MEIIGETLKKQKSSFKIVDRLSKERAMSQEERERAKADAYNLSEGNLHKLDGYKCDICRNKGYIAEVRDHKIYISETIVPCKCQKIRKALNRLKRSGLKELVTKYTFANYEAVDEWQRFIKDKAAKFCNDESKGNWFFIGGQSGCGKSHLCTAIAIKLLKKGLDVKYMLWRDEVTTLKAMLTDAEEYSEKMKELKETKILYIDDLFKSGKDETGKAKQPTAADINIAFEIINYRYNNPDLITIISSERTIIDLCSIDEATGGRIAEMTKKHGYCLNIKNDPKRNYRLRDISEI